MNKALKARAKKWGQTLIAREHTVRNWTHEDAQGFLERAWLAGARCLDRWHRGPFSELARLRQANQDMRMAMLNGLPELERLRKVDHAAKLVVAAWWRDGINSNDPQGNDAMQALVEVAAPYVKQGKWKNQL